VKQRPLFHERVRPYLRNERVRLCDGLDWCGEMNTLPTATRPLSDFKTYTREQWGIFPHAKVQLVSVPTMMGSPAKLIMTTGAVTVTNYVPKRAGIKASFHHVFGAVLVEIDDRDGTFFCRHLIADDDGSFYDLDRYVNAGEVTAGHRIRALTPGDIHVVAIDPDVSRATFGTWPTEDKCPDGGRIWRSGGDCLLDKLRPEHLFLHDLSDFHARNHHEIRDPHARFDRYIAGNDTVEKELCEDAMFVTLVAKHRPWLSTHVVDSNHNQALLKWLNTADYREDPPNALFFLRAQTAVYEAKARGDKHFNIYEYVMRNAFEVWRCEGVNFLREGGRFPVDGVEHANHGHRGANGARGSLNAYVQVGPKCTIGHMHSAAIIDGLYVAGTSSLLDLGYNKGPSSWSHSHVVQYKNGKRAIITLQKGKWSL
jgi:hypothetical protein